MTPIPGLRHQPKLAIQHNWPYHSANHQHFYSTRWLVANAYGGSTQATRAKATQFIYNQQHPTK